jgi:biofilm PGA synthesis N-glycosyltransferase PgaC
MTTLTAHFSELLLAFVFFYPLFMAYIWSVGSVYYFFHWERDAGMPSDQPPLPPDPPLVSILVPCFNEQDNLEETISALAAQSYPNIEIVAINDGSRDRTGAALDAMQQRYPTLRVVHFANNQGKAMGLRMGALVARGEYLVCIDGDAVLHPNAVSHLVHHFFEGPRVGAVTGNPRIRTRSRLLGRIQVGEFSSIIGLIKRTQRIYGNVFTVSGVVCAFRRSALHMSGYWNLDMVTEDIDVSWMLQLNHWSIRYEPNAVAWILMPETISGLWRQRLRWAQGGGEVFLRYFRKVWSWRHRRMWMLVFEYMASTLWAYAFLLSILLWLVGRFVTMPVGLNLPSAWPPAFWGITLMTTYLIQSAVAIAIERHYDHAYPKTLFWVIWYPMAFWIITCVTSAVGFVKAVFKKRDTRATWKSPDRGFRSLTTK